ncbi:MAG: DUF4412 domain-containing protein [Balneolaceae bacterium]|nr:DUF4412 domain-containing protein [Balneolaceae bacterium]MBO6547896.1 DUF4412 domain-containing protein [Balneolaceae bacterium]MBO6648409.1 DUF4412 domain-containing protein [Balneolaceae bacterium]
MKIKKILFGFAMLGLMGISTNVFAQFEGQVTMKLYSENNGIPQTSEMNLYATANRIILKGDQAVSFSDDFDASGLLIRNDKKDFVVLMGENKGLQFTKEELEGFFQMAGMMSDDNPEVNSDTDFRYTNKTRTINGYECTELLIENDEDKNSVSIWLTSGIDINWGMLAEPWKNVPESMRNSSSRLTQEFKSKNFPMLIEVHEKGNTETVFEVTNVNKSSVAKAMVEIPSGVNLIGLQELIFSMMMGN